ncbi:MAG: permease [Halobacteriales archaeon]
MASEEQADGRLLALYRRYIGEPDAETDVYLGFALFFGGIAFGLLGFVIFLGSVGVTAGTDLFWQLREIAIVLATIGLPAFLIGIVVLLPVSDRARYGAAVGGAVSLIAVIAFIAVYPQNWNVQAGPDYSAEGIAVYAIGLAILVAATGAALVAHQLERVRPGSGDGDASDAPATGGGGSTGSSGEDAAGETVTDEQVRADIDDALSGAELTWGGVEKSDTKRLQIETDAPELDDSQFEDVEATTTRSAGNSVDDAVAGLQQLKGGQPEEASSEGTVDDQTAALRELKEQQEQELAEEDDGALGRLKRTLGLE